MASTPAGNLAAESDDADGRRRRVEAVAGAGSGSMLPAQPLTAPAVMPETIWRWKKMNMMSGGIVMNSTSANSRFHCVLHWLANWNSVSWTVALSLPGRK